MAAELDRSLDERPTLQLAPLHGEFIGRERELAELTRAIDAGVPTIWISGASGIGKTALLEQLVSRCRERALPYYWLGPHELATPGTLRAIAGELARAAGARDGQRVLVIDDFAVLRPIESWFVDRFVPGLSPHITVVVADRSGAPAWRGDRGMACALGPLPEPAARRYLALRGVPDRLHAEILACAEGIPAILASAAGEARASADLPGGVQYGLSVDRSAAFYARHDCG
ncbi:MAG TPA: ATP-binding protein, partial [Kofleriaceae bacterium]